MDYAQAELSFMLAVIGWHATRKRWWNPVAHWRAQRRLSRICEILFHSEGGP